MNAFSVPHFSHNTNLVPLQCAVLCANCELISEANNGHCASCDSEALLNLSQILGCSVESEARAGLTPRTQVAAAEIFRIRFTSTAA